MPRVLTPGTMRRQRVPYRTAMGDAQLGDLAAIAAAASGLSSLASTLSGSSHKFAGTSFEGAEQARADAGALGAAAGNVQAARYLLSQQKTNTSNYAKSATAAAIQQATAANPATMQQARATPLTDADKDQADGTGVLGILYQLKIPLTDPYAGYSTNTGGPGSSTAMGYAAYLRQLPPLTSSPLPGVGVTPTTSTTVGPIPSNAPSLSLVGALPISTIQDYANKIAQGALNISQLANLGSADLQLIQQQVAAIKAGNVPPGGLSVFVANNKGLITGAGIVLGAVIVGRAVFGGRR